MLRAGVRIRSLGCTPNRGTSKVFDVRIQPIAPYMSLVIAVLACALSLHVRNLPGQSGGIIPLFQDSGSRIMSLLMLCTPIAACGMWAYVADREVDERLGDARHGGCIILGVEGIRLHDEITTHASLGRGDEIDSFYKFLKGLKRLRLKVGNERASKMIKFLKQY